MDTTRDLFSYSVALIGVAVSGFSMLVSIIEARRKTKPSQGELSLTEFLQGVYDRRIEESSLNPTHAPKSA